MGLCGIIVVHRLILPKLDIICCRAYFRGVFFRANTVRICTPLHWAAYIHAEHGIAWKVGKYQTDKLLSGYTCHRTREYQRCYFSRLPSLCHFSCGFHLAWKWRAQTGYRHTCFVRHRRVDPATAFAIEKWAQPQKMCTEKVLAACFRHNDLMAGVLVTIYFSINSKISFEHKLKRSNEFNNKHSASSGAAHINFVIASLFFYARSKQISAVFRWLKNPNDQQNKYVIDIVWDWAAWYFRVIH